MAGSIVDKLEAFNIDFISLSKEEVKNLQQIKSLSIFDQTKTNFDPEGLFSTAIFGKVGSEYRNKVFGYIDLKTPLLHPFIYKNICDLKSLYKDIMAGKKYAVWNAKERNFEESNLIEGQTGYEFFINHLPKLDFEKNNSISRTFKIDMINKAIREKKHFMQYLLVMPAGYRDYSLDENGRPQEDEINTYYRKLMMQTNLLIGTDYASEQFDSVKFTMQSILLEIFEYIKNMLEGKNKLILGKWMARKVFNTTRNVATSNIEKAISVNDPTRLKYNETFIGLNQFLRNTSPKSLYYIKNKYLSRVFIPNTNEAILVNSQTLQKQNVYITDIEKDYDLWVSPDGLEKVLENYSNLYTRHDPVTIANGEYYIGLIYKDARGFKFISGIDELPEGFSKENVSPITMTELLYMSVYELDGEIPAFITRYPIAAFGSIYPSLLRLKTTSVSSVLHEYDDNWQLKEKPALSFPIRGKDFYNTTSVHPSHTSRLTLDFDGDTLSVQAVLSDNAIEEVKKYLKSPRYYFDANGKLNFSIENTTLNSTLAYMTS